ncbi:MAG: MerR family DNA-binding protein [Elusimicrobia bacterium]|nr:MerR family DNA-binding protein [Elusimicrobiota bacterium]
MAKRAHVNIQTVLYYERRGLLIPEDHKDSGYRLYAEEAIRKIRFIKNAQALGFTLKEIEDLLELRISRRARSGRVKLKAAAKLREVEAKINALQAMRRTLLGLMRNCCARRTTDRCPILKSLDDKGGDGT